MSASSYDQAKADAFANRTTQLLNDSSLALMLSIGHQLSLFDTLAEVSPATNAQVAAAAGLNERYVREWLAALVTGRMVEYDPDAETYALPPEHAAALTQAAGFGNLAREAQLVPLLAQVEPRILECFRHGGGVPYSAYPRFQHLMAEGSATVHDSALIRDILPIVPGLVERLRAGADVLDVGCGSGHALNLMAQAFPASRFTGYDFSEEGIIAGRNEVARLGLRNACFSVRDAATLAEPDVYDVVMAFDAIHDQAEPARVLAGIGASLRPDGMFLMVDIAASSRLEENLGHTWGPWMYTISCLHCMTVSLAYGGAGLGAMWGKQTAQRMLAEAGFTQVEVLEAPGDVFNYYYVARRS
jgi:SAM-dependent methyltransferase